MGLMPGHPACSAHASENVPPMATESDREPGALAAVSRKRWRADTANAKEVMRSHSTGAVRFPTHTQTEITDRHEEDR